MLGQLGIKFSNLAKGSTKVQKQVLGLLSKHARVVTTRSDEFLQFFANAYDALGYDLPPILQYEEEQQAEITTSASREPAVQEVVAAVVIAAAVEIPEDEPTVLEPTASTETIQEINELRTELTTRIENAAQPWRLSRRKLKENGLDQLQVILRAGVGVESPIEGMGEWGPLAPMTADRAAMFLGTLVRIKELGQTRQGREAVQQALAEAAEERRSLIDAANMLSAYAADEHHSAYIRPNHPHDPLRELQLVADNWHIYSRLFNQVAPEGFAGNVWQHLPEPQPNSRYAALLQEYHSYNHNTQPIPITT